VILICGEILLPPLSLSVPFFFFSYKRVIWEEARLSILSFPSLFPPSFLSLLPSFSHLNSGNIFARPFPSPFFSFFLLVKRGWMLVSPPPSPPSFRGEEAREGLLCEPNALSPRRTDLQPPHFPLLWIFPFFLFFHPLIEEWFKRAV